MMNLKSLFAVMALISLLLAAFGLARFVVDYWVHVHPAGAGAPNPAGGDLDYRGIDITVISFVPFVFFALLYISRKH
jgi:hypothetical protein